MSEVFKVGDKVRVRKLDTYKTGTIGFARPSMERTIGQVGTVTHAYPTYVSVRFGDSINDYWNYEFDWIEKVEDFAPVLAEYETVAFDGKSLTVPISTPEQLRAALDKLGVPKKDPIRDEFIRLGWEERGDGGLERGWGQVKRNRNDVWCWLSGTGLIDSIEKVRAVNTLAGE